MRVRTALLLPLCLLLGACMPWTLGQTAETLRPGRLEAGIGVTAIAPPAAPADLLPVPQAWIRVGVREAVDAGFSYVFPTTGYGDLKLRLSRSPHHTVSAAVGAGVHAIPAALEETVYTPFLGIGVLASSGSARDGPVGYAAVRGFIPFAPGEDPAATLWLSGNVGGEWRRARLRFGPELGILSQVTSPGEVLLLAGLSARWSWR